MPYMTYGKDKKELKASNPKAIDFVLKQRLKTINKNTIIENSIVEVIDNQKKNKVVINAPTVKEFIKRSK